jgi:hypothetical protein
LETVAICSIAKLDTPGDGTASVVAAVLIDSRGAELLGMVFTGCVKITDSVSLSAVRLVALAVDLVDVGSSEALGTGMLATWSLAVLSVEAALAIADVVAANH